MTIGVAVSIGERVQRIQLEVAGPPVPDGDGGYTEGYVPLDPPDLFAKIEPASVRSLERFANGTVVATATHVVTMPFHPDVTTQTRVTWLDPALRSHHGNVTSVVNIDERCHTLVLAVAEQVP